LVPPHHEKMSIHIKSFDYTVTVTVYLLYHIVNATMILFPETLRK